MSHIVALRNASGATMKVEEFCKFGVTYDAIVAHGGKVSIKSGFRKIKSARKWAEREAHVNASDHRCETCGKQEGWHYPSCPAAV